MENLPTNSGIMPYLIRSSGLTSARKLLPSLMPTSAPNPIPPTCFLSNCFSRSVKAPPTMNNILRVSISTMLPSGCFLPPAGGTRHSVPSTIFNSPCCTPSPDTSRVMLTPSLFLEILSISSMNIIPFSVSSLSPLAALYSLLITFSTSSPT